MFSGPAGAGARGCELHDMATGTEEEQFLSSTGTFLPTLVNKTPA